MMNKKEYMAPRIVLHKMKIETQLLAGSEQSPYADSKPNRPFIDDEDDEWLDDDGWE